MGYKTTYYTTRKVAITQALSIIQSMSNSELCEFLDDKVNAYNLARFEIIPEDEIYDHESFRVVKSIVDMDNFFGI